MKVRVYSQAGQSGFLAKSVGLLKLFWHDWIRSSFKGWWRKSAGKQNVHRFDWWAKRKHNPLKVVITSFLLTAPKVERHHDDNSCEVTWEALAPMKGDPVIYILQCMLGNSEFKQVLTGAVKFWETARLKYVISDVICGADPCDWRSGAGGFLPALHQGSLSAL